MELLKQLNKGKSIFKISSSIGCDKVKVLSRFNLSNIQLILEANRWAIDQVLFSPEILDAIDNADIQILTSSNSFSLVRENGMINSTKYSDHLPILVKLKSKLIKDGRKFLA